MIDKVKRDIDIVTSDMQAAIKGEKVNFIAIGTYLLEAQELLAHGEWLKWLEANFGKSVRSAQNYMNAARFASKYATVAHLKLRPSALYWLGGDLTSPEEIEAVLRVAETEWVDYERASEIANSLHEEQGHDELAEAARTEAEDTLAGPPPELPPAPEPAPTDFTLQEFDEAVATLLRLHTKLIASFAATTHTLEVFNTVQEFLGSVARQLEKK